jgi:TP901 family phage tail tape measure protein
MAAKDYTLLLKASIDSTTLQSQIDALSEKYSINLKINADDTAIANLQTKVQQVQSQLAQTPNTDWINAMSTEEALDIIKQKIEDIQASGKGMNVGYTISSVPAQDENGDSFDAVTKATMSYTDALGNLQTATLKYDESSNMLVESNNKLSESMAQIQSQAIKENAIFDAQQKTIERLQTSASEFLAKSKLLDQGNPNVQSAVAIAKQMTDGADRSSEEMIKLGEALKIAKAGIDGTKVSALSFAEGMRNAIVRTTEYALSVGLLYGALNQLKQGIQYIIDLNAEMTKIQVLQVEGAKTTEQINSLAGSFNNLAKELGTTTIEVAKGSVEWLRQGKTIAETQELIKSTMMLSKLGALDSASATEDLTAVLNGFQMQASDASRVVDKLVAIDNIAATSAGELSSALQYSSAVANETGVSFDNLTAYIATASSRTRLSAEMIGQAFRTMFTRMQSVKSGAIDETGMNLNAVEKSLHGVGIALRDSTDSFRPLEDVIADVAGKWKTLDEVQRAQIATAIAGQRQSQIFQVLMQNWGDVAKYVSAETDSVGLATQRYDIYLKSVAASQAKFADSLQALWQSTISSGMITWWIDLGTALLNVFSNAGGLNSVILILTESFLIWKSAAIGGAIASLFDFVSTVKSANAALLVMDAEIDANPLGLFAAALAAVTIGVMAWKNSIQTTDDKIKSLNKDIDDLNSKLNKDKSGADNLRSLTSELENLRSKTSLTIDEQQRMFDIQQQIRDILPSVAGHYDDEGHFILDDSVSLSKLVDLKNQELELDRKKLEEKTIDRIKTETQAYKEQIAVLDRMVHPVTERQYVPGKGMTFISPEDIANQKQAIADLIDSIKSDFSGLTLTEQRNQIKMISDALQGMGTTGKVAAQELATSLTNALEAVSHDARDNKTAIQSINETYQDFQSTIKTLTDTNKILDDLMAKSETGKFTYSDIEALAKAYPDYLNVLRDENGQLTINTDAIRQYQVAQAKAALASAQSSHATAEVIKILQDYVNQMQGATTVTWNGAQVSKQAFDQMLWAVANNAAESGNKFRDMTGDALNSAQAIYDYMSASNANFNDFIRQAADITGHSVEDITNQINGMLNATAVNVDNLIALLGRSAGAYAARLQGLANLYGMQQPVSTIFNPAPVGYQYVGGLSDLQKGLDSASSAADKLKTALNDAATAAENSLNKQLDGYKNLIDARKKLLDSLQAEKNYNQEIGDKNKAILDIQNKLAALQFDTSEEANAERLKLQDELAKAQRDLQNTEDQHSTDQQKDALDAEYAAFEKRINSAIEAIKDINANSLSDFATQLAAILAKFNLPSHHSGVEAGIIGGQGLSSSEQFIKVMKGEVVVNEHQMAGFINKTLPSITNNAIGGNITVTMPLQVQGNLDASVLPAIDAIVNKAIKKLNDNLQSRGFNRRSDIFAI